MPKVTAPLHTEFDDWINGEPSNADRNFPIVAKGFQALYARLAIAAASTPVGVLYLEWSIDGTTWYPLALESGKYNLVDTGGHATVDESAGSVTFTALSALLEIALGIERPPPHVRWRHDWTSGGTATGASGSYYGLHR